MGIEGKVHSLWRYPVKSMRGEELETAFLGFAGVDGDRVLAFTSSGGPEGFPWLTGRERPSMLLYSPRFRHPAAAEGPANLHEAEDRAGGNATLCGSGRARRRG